MKFDIFYDVGKKQCVLFGLEVKCRGVKGYSYRFYAAFCLFGMKR